MARLSQDFSERNSGLIFLSPQSLISFAYGAVATARNPLWNRRALSIHGAVDLPFQFDLEGSFDTVEFAWPTIARRIVRDLILSTCTNDLDSQTVFRGKWNSRIRRDFV